MVPLPNGRTLLSKPTTERQPEVNEYFHEDPSRKNCSPQELRQGEVRKNIVGRCASLVSSTSRESPLLYRAILRYKEKDLLFSFVCKICCCN